MDESSIVSALQSDLQNYKVKTQIRRKESQLHVLITRSEEEHLDYDSLYNIVKHRIDKLPIEGANTFILYGRLAGAKHPEWQKTGDIKPPLPLIELDLDELEDLDGIGELGHLTFPIEMDESDVQTDSLQPNVPESFDSFKQSIENDLRRSSLQASNNNLGNHKNGKDKTLDLGADLGSLDLEEFKLDYEHSNSFEPNSTKNNFLQSSTIELTNQSSNNQSPREQNNWTEEDFGLDDITLAMPMPLPPPPPPLPPTRRIPSKVVVDNEVNPEPQKSHPFNNKSLLISGSFAIVAIGILGICGWLLWERSVQQKYVANARELSSANISPKTVAKLEDLAETRNRLQAAIAKLEDIADRPASLYTDAQVELNTLRPKLEEFDRKIILEQGSSKKIESAKNGTIEAAKLVLNPPHKSTVWKYAQEKRQQAIKLLEEVPKESLLYADAQSSLKVYRSDLAQINKRLQMQQQAESVANNVNPNIVSQLKQIKTRSSDKQKFLPQCKAILQAKISNADAQRVGLNQINLIESLCAYFWE